MKAYVEAYGCTLNVGESKETEELLAGKGWEIVDDPSGSDLVVLVTCVVIEATERAMLKRLRELSSAPRLVVTGCMASACRDRAEKIVPSAEFIPPGSPTSLAELIGDVGPVRHSVREEGSCSIVPIATGCKGTCAYCITRLARGDLRSRSVETIVESVRRWSAGRPREIQITAQDTAAYGSDIGTDLPTLVRRICDIPHDFRLRIGMMNPSSALAILDPLCSMFKEPKVFKFLHLPVQTASDRLLRDMDRGYTASDFTGIVSDVRSKVPGITLSTDLIVGYPGETEEDHRANLLLIEEALPDIVNVTRYSSRPGTKAAASGTGVVGWKTKDRSREITKTRFRVSLRKNKELVGKRVKALATEHGKDSSTILRTDEYKQLIVRAQLELGRYYDLVIREATPTYLMASRRITA
jgi:threonylcarbamoyladenosine tRNA methylthiotransferase CDKAL1